MVFGKRTRWVLIVLLLAAAVTAGTISVLRLRSAPTAVALINGDTGPLGARIAKELQGSGTRHWDVVDEASTKDYAAVVTLPTDLSTDITSLLTDKPKRAQVTVTTHDRADPNLVNDAVAEVTKKISAAGLDTLFATMNTARLQVSQIAGTSQLLGAGVQAAADGAQQFSGGADQMMDFLNQAKSGAGQLTSGIDALNSTLSAATTQANQLAAALDSTGVTMGQVSQAAGTLSNGLDFVVPLLQALPFANDPQLANVITQLQGLQNVANQANTQLSGFANLTGTQVTPDTEVGQLLRDAAGRLNDASTQLNQGASLAQSIPAIADQAGTQLVAAMQALTGGVTQLQAVTKILGNQTNQAMGALPQLGVPQQTAIAATLTDPVDIIRK
ncbi:YhgE/Pip domain-containing protein [Nocardia sp. NPDC101769]|uniref:YhgE/Pip domain-containing protein n=1 Tax=Nocardia sp. NPDC101769 TaxID=3364333 RepID=UPI00381F98CF